MNDIKTQAFLASLFLTLTCVYYFVPYSDKLDTDKVFLTLSTFLFALLAGFFIARQATRYSELRKLIAGFDGNLSSIYRAFGHYSSHIQDGAGEIIKKHYKNILEYGWDYPILNKTNTITSLHILLEQAVRENGNEDVKGSATVRIMLSLSDLQKLRKGMSALRGERIPSFQWTLVYVLTAILLAVVSSIASQNILLGSIVKAAFVTAVISVVILLIRLDNLQLFSGKIGTASAQDAIDIIDNKK